MSELTAKVRRRLEPAQVPALYEATWPQD